MTPDHADSRPLRQVIGEAVRRVREAAGARQDDVARTARLYGLAWDHSRVAALERGEKAVGIEELVTLLMILTDVCNHPVTISELIPNDANIRLTDSVSTDGITFRGMLAGQTVSFVSRRAMVDEITRRVMDAFEERGVPGVAEERAARRLGISTATLTTATRDLWGRTLTEERDRVVAERADTDDDPGRLRALRGRVTRQLVDELAKEIKKRESGA